MLPALVLPVRLALSLLLALGAAGVSAAPGTGPVAQLQDLYTSEWAWRQQQFGQVSEDGEWKSTDHFPSNTPEACAAGSCELIAPGATCSVRARVRATASSEAAASVNSRRYNCTAAPSFRGGYGS